MTTVPKWITADALAQVKHGFFTRQGGVSTGIYAGLNCSKGSHDDAVAVVENRARAAKAMDVAADHLISVHQYHSDQVVLVDKPFDTAPKADAMVTGTRGLALGILTADCQPVLFYDAAAQVIGAAHAGWKGTQAGILSATVTAMERLGAKRDNITAVIGPCISQRAYEVGPEFFDTLTLNTPEAAMFFAAGRGDKMQFNLPLFGLHLLRAEGIKHAEWTGHCTYEDAARFYSYRRATHQGENDYGRLISIIRL